ncbi:hypothetical protein [Methanobacterium congolense]|uniref:Uncharacterized protein n=1 Tax=Methanobacterium congolense TaxID=118062 RepID=A0A1D3L366_9EURY|nr:hypothetical protein [Methanobacterium congolense]SCG85959.1 putative protein [Methanobacterium congolense]
MILIESGMLNVIQYVAIGIGAVNISLLFGLLYIYWTSYKKIKSEFTIGLLYFTLVLLLQNVLATGVLVMLLISGAGTHNPEGMEHLVELFTLNAIQLVALGILFRITW